MIRQGSAGQVRETNLPSWRVTVTRTIEVPGRPVIESILLEELVYAESTQEATRIATDLMKEHTGDSFRVRRDSDRRSRRS